MCKPIILICETKSFRMIGNVIQKRFWHENPAPYFCTPKTENGSLVNRLRRLPFTEE
jgi:hypothetical protein